VFLYDNLLILNNHIKNILAVIFLLNFVSTNKSYKRTM